MEDSEFSVFPEEVVLNIFKYLNKSSLKEVAMTCRAFHRISNEVPWSLRLSHNNQVGVKEEWADTILESDRKFTKVKIEEMLEMNHMIKFFRKHGGKIQELYLFDCVLDNSTIFLEMLHLMPKLCKCILYETSALASFEEPSPDDVLPKLEKLEILEMVKSEFRILEYFRTAQVKNLQILDSADGSIAGIQPLLNFFTTQKALKSLALRLVTADESQLFQSPIKPENIPFKLQKLSLLGFKLRKEPNDYNNLKKFLQIHARTVVELEIGRYFPDFIFEFIFSKFKKLKSLKISTKGIPQDEDCYNRLDVNESVTKLVICDESQANNEPLENFLVHLPNIETLVIGEDFDAEAMQFISRHCEKIRHLVIGEMKNVFNDLSFPLLETLHVDFVFEAINWAQFARANPNIKELSIKTIEADMLNIGEITSNLKLQKLRLGANFVTDFDFFDTIRRNCKDLKLLTVHRSSIAISESEVVDIPALRYHQDEVFHWTEFVERKDGEFWNVQDYDANLDDDDLESLGLEEMDPFDLQLMLDELDFIQGDEFQDDDEIFDVADFHGFF